MNHQPVQIVPILIQAGLLISKPQNWTQGALARRASGAALANPTVSSAKQWDVIGAIYAAGGVNPAKPDTASRDKQNQVFAATAAVAKTASRLRKKTTEAANDSEGHEQALELIRATIRRERAVMR